MLLQEQQLPQNQRTPTKKANGKTEEPPRQARYGPMGPFLANVGNVAGIIFSLLGNYLGSKKSNFQVIYLYVWGFPHWIIFMMKMCDNADVLAADTTDVLAADKYVADGKAASGVFPSKNTPKLATFFSPWRSIWLQIQHLRLPLDRIFGPDV